MQNRKIRVMGILNITPDSFSDGGKYLNLAEAVDRTAEMIREGADIIDIGGESTRPGAIPVPLAEELARVIPVIEAIKQRFSIAISVDTSKADVMRHALQLGADIINDVTALSAPEALAIVANSTASVCLMHMQGNPQTMQQAPYYSDVVTEVKAFLQKRIYTCLQAGITKERIIVDPGIGFGKTLTHNLALLRDLHHFVGLGDSLLIGFSRKRLLIDLLNPGQPATTEQSLHHERLYGGLALTSWSIMHGAHIIRTHDVAATVKVVKVMEALQAAD